MGGKVNFFYLKISPCQKLVFMGVKKNRGSFHGYNIPNNDISRITLKSVCFGQNLVLTPLSINQHVNPSTLSPHKPLRDKYSPLLFMPWSVAPPPLLLTSQRFVFIIFYNPIPFKSMLAQCYFTILMVSTKNNNSCWRFNNTAILFLPAHWIEHDVLKHNRFHNIHNFNRRWGLQ